VTNIFASIIKAEAERADRELLKKAILGQRIKLQPAGNGFDELRQRFSEPLLILMSIVALVLLIACANVANLLLAKAAQRQREIVIRLAVGARRRRIVQQLLTESLLLSITAGAIGVLLAHWLSNGLVTMMSNGGPRMPLESRPDARVLSFAGLASLIACLLFGLAPAILASRQSFRPGLSEIRADRWRLGKGLIVAQVAISTLLLIGAGLFGRTLLSSFRLTAMPVTTAKAFASPLRLRNQLL